VDLLHAHGVGRDRETVHIAGGDLVAALRVKRYKGKGRGGAEVADTWVLLQGIRNRRWNEYQCYKSAAYTRCPLANREAQRCSDLVISLFLSTPLAASTVLKAAPVPVLADNVPQLDSTAQRTKPPPPSAIID
jgi:hypothetical protein